MPEQTHTILIREPHWQMARAYWLIYGEQLDEVAKVEKGTFKKIAIGLKCPTCNAPDGIRCVTKSGQVASRLHDDRYKYALAAMFAVRDEPTITEEPDIEDALGA